MDDPAQVAGATLVGVKASDDPGRAAAVALDGCRVLRPAGLDDAVEIVSATPQPRAFPTRVNSTLIICVKRGVAHEVVMNGRSVVYPAHAVCVTTPGTVWSSKRAAVGFLSLDVAPELIPYDLRGPMRFLERRQLPGAVAAIRSIARPGDRLERQVALAELVDAVLLGDARDAEANQGVRAVDRAVDYLEAMIEHQPSLDDIARAAGANRFVLVRHFRHKLGITPYAYLLQLRVGRARRLLARGVSAVEVAWRAGFADQAHMSRHFKRVFGLSPVHYARTSSGKRGPGQ